MQLPTPFIEKYQRLLGEEAPAFFTALTDNQPVKGFRLNVAKPHAQAMLAKYGPAAVPAPYAEAAYIGEVKGRSLLHQAGYVYSQEPSAMIVATIAAAQPGERVLDLCAAPGGKTTQLASQLQGKGLLVANEIFPKRAKILSENVERWGFPNVVVTNQAPQELSRHFPQFFDKIVVDAPCSGEGMFRKDPVALEEWQADTPDQCAIRQKDILAQAVAMLKPGGQLIYSTCTFAPEENEAMMAWLMEEYPFTIEAIDLANVSHGRSEWGAAPGIEKTIRLWPHLNQGEGHFAAKLTSLAEAAPVKKKKKGKGATAKSPLDAATQKLWQAFRKEFPFLQALNATPQLLGENLWLVPEEMPSLKGIKFMRPGLHVGVVKKNRIEPSYALALAIHAEEGAPTVPITLPQWQQYVAGETLSVPGNAGWVILTVDEIPVGFGKQVQGTVKNFFPKGLRFKAI
ncbi:RsmB/NOP family class I SAM-dependent RNA methyltransferase [uncultured Enterococcus sp.]|uniref:RsmB/NOP family class I SAM-dependent RNA methyltransferase n=1 Tax=uncultured Enterococcus sp. TaxID=167972 RepID=UPI00259B264A|nr:RsmB/NOP family class I SAM-dependent RNA methyltransferase [uncultured Enterococcus sp.]